VYDLENVTLEFHMEECCYMDSGVGRPREGLLECW